VIDDDEDSDDEKELEAMKKAFGGVAISNKPSLFDDATSTCLMAKVTKVTYNDDACDDDDSCSDDDEDLSKEELMDMCEQLNEGFQKKRKECKGLLKKVQDLEKSLSELQASHECLKEDYEELENAHTKLAKAHSILLDQAKVEDVKETRSIGLTCDIMDESFYKPIVISQANPSCSFSPTTTDSSSSMSDGFTCDASLMVENETLKREVDELTHALGKAYGGEACLLKCFGTNAFLSTKRDWAIPPRRARRPLQLQSLTL